MNLTNNTKKNNITFILFTYNEEKRIKNLVKYLLSYGDVIISDDSSKDNTVKIAEKLGAKVIKRKTHIPNAENKEEAEFIFSYVKTDWVFWGFADEIVPLSCLKLYTKLSKSSKYKIVVQKRKTLIYNSENEYFPSEVAIKFYRKDSIDFTDNKIHQSGNFAKDVKWEEVLYLPPIDEYSIYHFQIFTTENYLKNVTNYALIQAKTGDKKFSGLRVIVDPIFAFLVVYFFQGTVRYGVKGFIAAMQAMFYSFTVKAKSYEIKNNINANSIEKKFKKKKLELLKISPKSNILQKIIAYFKIAIISFLHKKYKFKQRDKLA